MWKEEKKEKVIVFFARNFLNKIWFPEFEPSVPELENVMLIFMEIPISSYLYFNLIIL